MKGQRTLLDRAINARRKGKSKLHVNLFVDTDSVIQFYNLKRFGLIGPDTTFSEFARVAIKYALERVEELKRGGYR